MRTPAILLLSTLAACATSAPPGADPEWQQVQAGRLERLHGPRNPTAAVAAILGQDPQPATARREARHIDQREPAGFRPFQEPKPGWVANATIGTGNVGVRVKGTQLDDRAPAQFLRLAVDSDKATGLQIETWSSDTELYVGRRINDGVDPAAADASLRGLQLFPHLRLDEVRHGIFSMPVRVGMFGDWQRLAHESASVEREWVSIGPRLLLEPTVRLVGDDSAWLELVGRLAGEVGPAWFTEEFRGGDDHDVTSRWSTEFGLGLRGHVGRMQAELGYDLHHTTMGSVDSELLGDRSKTELQRQQLYFGLGLKF
jgi:hypothetical protein